MSTIKEFADRKGPRHLAVQFLARQEKKNNKKRKKKKSIFLLERSSINGSARFLQTLNLVSGTKPSPPGHGALKARSEL